MRKCLLFVIVAMAVAFMAQAFLPKSYGAEPAAKSRTSVPADVEPMPNIEVAQSADDTNQALFNRRQQKDEGLKQLIEKKFDIERPNVFAGFRILMWGLTIAGILLGLFFAAVIVILALRLLRKVLIPAATGLPAAPSLVEAGTLGILNLLDSATKKLQERRDQITAEQTEIDKRLGKSTETKVK